MSEQSTVETREALTVTGAARVIGVSEKTVRKRIAAGAIEAEKVTLAGGGWAWRVNPERLETPGSVKEGSKRVREAGGSRDGTFHARDGSATEDFESVTELSGENVPTASKRFQAREGTFQPLLGDDVPSVPSAQDVQLARIEGYLAANMASAVESAVRAATAPLFAQLETMNQTNAKLLSEIEETRSQVEAMRADKDADRAQLSALEEILAILAAPKPEVISTVEFDRTPQSITQSTQNAPQAPQNSVAGKATGASQSAQQRHERREPRPLWKLILGVR